jgi:hypothetical protein
VVIADAATRAQLLAGEAVGASRLGSALNATARALATRSQEHQRSIGNLARDAEEWNGISDMAAKERQEQRKKREEAEGKLIQKSAAPQASSAVGVTGGTGGGPSLL